MKLTCRTVVFILLSFSCLILEAENPLPVLQRFEYHDVRLTSGRLKQQLDETCELYLNIPNNDLLKGFRQRMNMPTYGARDMGGWYSGDVFHAFGQFLSGLSRLYAATGNEQCRIKVNDLIDGWAETIEPDGYFFYTKKPNAPHYVYEKMQAGLLDAFLFTGNRKALEYMSTITDWAIENLDKERHYPYDPKNRNVEWYTLSENLYRAYEASGDQKYYDFANFWEYPQFWNKIGQGKNIMDEKIFYHAYSHLNSLSGAAMAYTVKNDPKYLNTLIGGYDFFVNNQSYITGGFGPTEQLVPYDDKQIITNLSHHSFETQCGSWAAFKLSKYLLEFTGNGKYGDWIEKLLINGIGASIPMTSTGAVMYYSDYNCKHATKHNYFQDWSCCTGTRPQAIADYVNLIYFKDEEGIYVNYFTPSTVDWNSVVLEQSGRFPEEPGTWINVRSAKSKDFSINIRKPLWIRDKMIITVNGNKVNFVERNGWIRLTRTWMDGDVIAVTMPMSFSTQRINPEDEYPVAMAYGPVVLAVTGDIDNYYPLPVINLQNPGKNLVLNEKIPLFWQVENHPEWQVRAFYQLTENQPYIMYTDPKAQNIIAKDSIHISKEWNPRSFFASNKPGAIINTHFQGKDLRIYCYKNKNGGMFSVKIDGKDMGEIDLYGNEERAIHSFDFKIGDKGFHQVELTIVDKKNEKSSGTNVMVIGFESL